jgi:hypothetical protein
LAITVSALAPRRALTSVDSRLRIRRNASLLGLVSSFPRKRRMVKPRKSTPVSKFVIRVLVSLKTSPLGASHSESRALTCSACSRE